MSKIESKPKKIEKILGHFLATLESVDYDSITIVEILKKLSKFFLTISFFLFYYRGSETQVVGFQKEIKHNI